ncbi:aminotransferase class V-fold PLP-dependent enzyme [Corynebacterium xerosis]|jgi:selenocysteine lyase/cysteine desulfurase|uniref:Aminotransferase class V-fold PLP-dependent enzyme n=1 Tax=Corynebacterium xerosis TaxID=1725 RepID=A0A0M2XMK1_9CORY|nr:aminotransferase class V-fold PLP-dependent enzyme [Corynebacterium xerosis]SQB95459.1 SufS subfamily cysteine desulfurase [Clostridium paraputrificum]AYJ33316.1 aminotransferase class V-fold PLP-dependent enzyme [Corynebacterium xerosis]KKO82746.1 cysteine desulfurase [Corynebacterium xerosis]NMF08913.1 aminotransferase class V-fold PLP-dependent enzyme [Corynebacterium xerosis]HJG56645.1 aminotransferase class V-fold PLP-dependent enzyme [Corynebacterium xerosis]
MAFDVPTTRGFYSSLSDGWTYLNGGERAQIPERVLSTMATAFRAAPKSLPGETGSGTHSREQVAGITAGHQFASAARRAFADVAGGRVEGVVLGPSREALVHLLMQAMGRRLSLGTGMVLTRTGDPVSQVPFRRAADMFGARVRFAEADLSTGAVPAWQFDELVTPDTRLVVVPAADPFVGAVAPVADIARRVRENSAAKVLVDASAYAPYRVVDMNRMGADIVLLDAAAWGGPQVSALVFRDPSLLDRMTSMALVPGARGRARLEVTTVAPSLLGGVSESVRHLADLDPVARGTRRHRIEQSMPQVGRYLSGLTSRLIDALGNLDQVHIVGVDGEGSDDAEGVDVDRVPRVSFIVAGVPAPTVVRRLLDNHMVTSAVGPGHSALLEAMGVMEAGGAVTVGLQPFNTPHDVDQLVRAVASLG